MKVKGCIHDSSFCSSLTNVLCVVLADASSGDRLLLRGSDPCCSQPEYATCAVQLFTSLPPGHYVIVPSLHQWYAPCLCSSFMLHSSRA
jgi:hypothetical protein